MLLQYIFLISTKCLWDLITALLFTLVPAILAWLGSRAVAQKKADEMQGNQTRTEESLNEARFNVSRLTGEVNGLSGQLAEARTDGESKNVRISHLYGQIEEQSKLAEDLQAKTKDWETREVEWQNTQNQLNETVARHEQELKTWTMRSGEWETERKTLTADVAAKETDLAKWSLRLSDWEQEKANLASSVTSRDADLSNWAVRFAKMEQETAALQEGVTAKDGELSQWTLRFGQLEQEKATLESAIANKESELEQMYFRMGDWENEKNALQSTLSTKDNDLAQWNMRFGDLEKEKLAFQQAATTKDEELSQWNIRLGQWEQERMNYATAIDGKDREIGEWNFRFGQWEQERSGYVGVVAAKDASIEEVTARMAAVVQERDRLSAESSDRMAQADHWRSEYAALQAQYDALRLRMGELESAQVSASRSFVLAGKIYRWDDLKIVEGIGPKIEGILQENGVRTWAQLSETSEERLKEILAAAGDRYKLADPSSWADQARLAHADDAEGLEKLQTELTGGREAKPAAPRKKTVRVDAELMERLNKLEAEARAEERRLLKERQKLAQKGSLKFLGRGFELDDHEVVEGIGPKIDEVLRQAEILTWLQLSETPAERIREILDAAGPQFRIADPTTWPQQAGLAHENKWEELAVLQAELTAGRE